MKADMNKIKALLETIAQGYNSGLQRAGADVLLEPGFDTDNKVNEDKEEEFVLTYLISFLIQYDIVHPIHHGS